MEQPLVSVVVPIYNVEKYLTHCIESIVNQTHTNLQIILVDDGSTDKSPLICDKWAEKDNRIKVIHKANAGQGLARNTGIDNATGKYIFFFDSDDYVADTIVEKCVSSAETNQSDVVIYGRNDVYEDGKVVTKPITAEKDVFIGDAIVDELLTGMFTYRMGFGVSCCEKMYNLVKLKRLGKRFVSEREIISEDAYFTVDVFSDISVVSIVRESLYFYLRRSNSFSRTYKKDKQTKNDVFYLKTMELIKSKNLQDKVLSHMAARYQIYTLAAMKQIVVSNLSYREKINELRNIYKSPTLQDTLNDNVIKRQSRALQTFYMLLRHRWYWICDVLLYVKSKKKA